MNENVYTTRYVSMPKFFFGAPYHLIEFKKIDICDVYGQCGRPNDWLYEHTDKIYTSDRSSTSRPPHYIYLGNNRGDAVFCSTDCGTHNITLSSHKFDLICKYQTTSDTHRMDSLIAELVESGAEVKTVKLENLNYVWTQRNQFYDYIDPHYTYTFYTPIFAIKPEFNDSTPDSFWMVYDGDEDTVAEIKTMKTYDLNTNLFSDYDKVIVVDSQTGSSDVFSAGEFWVSTLRINFKTGLMIPVEDFVSGKAVVVNNVITLIGGVR